MKFADAELLTREFLAPTVAPQRVVTRVPKDRPEEFVRVFRSGGAAASRVLDQPMITVTCWGKNCRETARKCRERFLNDYTDMPLARRVVEVTGPYDDPDPGTNTPRVTFTVQINLRAQR